MSSCTKTGCGGMPRFTGGVSGLVLVFGEVRWRRGGGLTLGVVGHVGSVGELDLNSALPDAGLGRVEDRKCQNAGRVDAVFWQLPRVQLCAGFKGPHSSRYGERYGGHVEVLVDGELPLGLRDTLPSVGIR